jgi:hypothetical protein
MEVWIITKMHGGYNVKYNTLTSCPSGCSLGTFKTMLFRISGCKGQESASSFFLILKPFQFKFVQYSSHSTTCTSLNIWSSSLLRYHVSAAEHSLRQQHRCYLLSGTCQSSRMAKRTQGFRNCKPICCRYRAAECGADPSLDHCVQYGVSNVRRKYSWTNGFSKRPVKFHCKPHRLILTRCILKDTVRTAQ